MHHPDENAPVGVFDSGISGISVLRKMVTFMPNENYIYYGDSVNAPYGERSDEEVFRLTENIVEHPVAGSERNRSCMQYSNLCGGEKTPEPLSAASHRGN